MLYDSPFFESVNLTLANPALDGEPTIISISAPGARTKPYIKSLTVNGVPVETPIIRHDQLLGKQRKVAIVYEMSDTVQGWGNNAEVLKALGVHHPGEDVKGSAGGRTRYDAEL